MDYKDYSMKAIIILIIAFLPFSSFPNNSIADQICNAYKNTEIAHLRLSFEKVTGQDLNWFFNQWFLSSGHPMVRFEQNYNAATKE